MCVAIVIVVWIISAIVTAGTTFAYFQGCWPRLDDYREDMGTAWLFGLTFGPIGTIATAFLSGFWKYGWRLR